MQGNYLLNGKLLIIHIDYCIDLIMHLIFYKIYFKIKHTIYIISLLI